MAGAASGDNSETVQGCELYGVLPNTGYMEKTSQRVLLGSTRMKDTYSFHPKLELQILYLLHGSYAGYSWKKERATRW